MDEPWLLVAPVKTAVGLQTTPIGNKVCSASTRNEQVEASVCCISFDDSSTNVRLFSSRKTLLFWKVFSGLRVICILTKACSFALW